MPTQSPAKSQYVKIPRYEMEQLMKELCTIANADKSTHLQDSGSAYAHALGACNGIAKGLIAALEIYTEVR